MLYLYYVLHLRMLFCTVRKAASIIALQVPSRPVVTG